MMNRTRYNFKDTIMRHSQGEIVAIQVEEVRNKLGDVVVETVEDKLEVGAIVSLSNEELRVDSGGSYNQDSRKLYCYKKLKKDDRIRNKMNNGDIKEYKILEHRDKSDFDDGLHIYYMERTDLS